MHKHFSNPKRPCFNKFNFKKADNIKVKKMMKLLNRLKIQHIIVGFIAISVLAQMGSLFFIHNNFGMMEDNWQTYKKEIKAKEVLLNKIEVEMGYDGAIHNYKNYILRGDEKYAKKFADNKSVILQKIEEYKSLPLIKLEEDTLTHIVDVIENLDQEIAIARPKHAQNIPVSEIDHLAQSGDYNLKNEFSQLSAYYDNLTKELYQKREGVRQSSEWAMVASAAIVLLLLAALKVISDLKIVRPLVRANNSVNAIANGSYDDPINIYAQDEIGETLTYIEKMRVSLKESVGNIQKALNEASTLGSTMEGLGTNVLITNDDEEIIYANKQSMKNLKALTPAMRKTFPDFDASKLMGASIHMFHKDPSRIKTILHALKPGQQHRAVITIGDLKLSLNAGGVFDKEDKRIGYYVEWQDVTQQYNIENQIKHIVGSINNATTDISQGNQNLSERTESQAASIQQTTASMQQITERVNDTAESAREASELSNNTKSSADRGGEVVKTAIQAMTEISESSKKINEIISVIDEIAFQTNLLALNAAVEAARAGEQGRGFAVVASEVRSLAGRSATAAKEIKELITDSVNKVESGSRQVNETGECLDEIIMSVQEVTRMVNNITQATTDQASGIDEINRAITQMDSFTQQNASLVEEAASASQSLKEQSDKLVEIVAQKEEK